MTLTEVFPLVASVLLMMALAVAGVMLGLLVSKS